ncbi:conserved hypothetical protein [Ricinus communis]|uniref:Uncharacterized protein n=1 Tax=Ricinus communis TaxID=3988 RepID=B9TDF3_RICCO|nr:conserved hypothetical protein [Ricinus communis]
MSPLVEPLILRKRIRSCTFRRRHLGHREDRLAAGAALRQGSQRLGQPREVEGRGFERTQPPFAPPVADLPRQPARQGRLALAHLAPQHADGRGIGEQQSIGRQLRERAARETDHQQARAESEAARALRADLATHRIEDEVHTVRRERAHCIDPAGIAVVDHRIRAQRAAESR